MTIDAGFAGYASPWMSGEVREKRTEASGFSSTWSAEGEAVLGALPSPLIPRIDQREVRHQAVKLEHTADQYGYRWIACEEMAHQM